MTRIKSWIPLLCFALGTPIGVAAQSKPVSGVQTGINRGTGEVPVRKNINDFAAEGSGPCSQQTAQWDLYIQAMRALQNMSDTNPLSYFQLAGIHGQPNIPYNGDSSTVDTSGWGGYCPHNEYKFITWHRPYVVLFEQSIAAMAQQIALLYPSNKIRAYQNAADTLRVPYWDWASDSSIPAVATTPTISVCTFPKGIKEEISNPLYAYNYPVSASNGQFGPFIGRGTTTRCSTGQGDSKLSAAGLTSLVYNVFVRAANFSTMASTESGGASFENPHNAVHMDCSCGGTMAYAEVSAFDPIFMMHHANVDRLFAIWQAVNYKQSTPAFSGTTAGEMGTPAGPTSPNDPLKPFYDTAGAYHTSQSVASIEAFAYSYPEIPFWNHSASELSQACKRSINTLYSGSSGSEKRQDGVAGAQTARYFAQLTLQRDTLPLPCTVSVVLEGREVGRVALLSVPASGVSHGEIALGSPARLAGMGPGTDRLGRRAAPTADVVREFFGRAIQVRVLRHDGTVVDSIDPSSIVLDVVDTIHQAPKSEYDFPSFVTRTKIQNVRPQIGALTS